jgi:malate dehydrogenase
MVDVAVIGAGELGGALAHVMARRNIVRTIQLVDAKGRVAEGKALDIQQAGPVEGFATRLAGSTDLATAGGAPIVVLADAMGGSEWQGEEGLAMLRRAAQMAPRAVFVCAGAAQRELVHRGVGELGLARERALGSAPEAMRAAARALVALELNIAPRDVALAVLGIPPAQLVIPWEEATAGGFALTRLLGEPARRRLSARIQALWPPGPYALANAACKVVEAILGRSRQLATCFVAPDRSAGRRSRTAAFPVRLSPSGISEVVVPSLSVVEQVALDNAVLL